MLSLPPHSTQKTQHLDRTFFKPFKTFYDEAADDWTACHPGQTLSIYHVAEIAAKAFQTQQLWKNQLTVFVLLASLHYTTINLQTMTFYLRKLLIRIFIDSDDVALTVLNNDETHLGNEVTPKVRDAVAEICQSKEEPQESAVTEETKDTIPVEGGMNMSSTPGPSSLSGTISHTSPYNIISLPKLKVRRKRSAGTAEAKRRPKESEQDFVSICKTTLGKRKWPRKENFDGQFNAFALAKAYGVAKGNSFRRYVAKILFTDKEGYRIRCSKRTPKILTRRQILATWDLENGLTYRVL
ncbi:hypothetical protein ILUMI_09294 [Ignelater luminosus]|uniref:Transposase n=1 Tax=Ignelater luminosus TaxID=2038154 RepID=A0A8K0D2P8_IGNLU|nr:hypothetical protein ILUMI_09294 [Ignelater luminosus]